MSPYFEHSSPASFSADPLVTRDHQRLDWGGAADAASAGTREGSEGVAEEAVERDERPRRYPKALRFIIRAATRQRR